MYRHRLQIALFLLAASSVGCFRKLDVNVESLRCASDQNCPTGTVCTGIEGTPPLGKCVTLSADAAGTRMDGTEVAIKPFDVLTEAQFSRGDLSQKEERDALGIDIPHRANDASGGATNTGGVVSTGGVVASSGGVVAGSGGIAQTGGLIALGGVVAGSGGVAGASSSGGTISQGGATTSVDAAPVDAPLAGAQLSMIPSITTLPTVIVGSESIAVVFTVSNNGDTTSGTLTTSLSKTTFVFVEDECQNAKLPGRGSCRISVKFLPTTVGDQSATLSVFGNPGGSVTATLQGTAIIPGTITIHPASFVFSETMAGASSIPASFILSNSGGTVAGTDGLLKLTLLGGHASEFRIFDSTCGPTLAPSSDCQVTVVFSPATPGTKSTSLSVSASPGGTAVSNLSGTSLGRCSLTADGLCPTECSYTDDMDCKKSDGTQCASATQCKSGNCTFNTCCGQSLVCRECLVNADCASSPSKPLCRAGTCSAGDVIAFYPFEVDARDATGTYHGTLKGDAAIVNDSVRGKVVEFKENGFVNLPNTVAGALENFSFTAWVKFAGKNEWAGLLGMGKTELKKSPYWDFHLRKDGTISFYSADVVYWPSDGCAQIVENCNLLDYSSWVHIAFSFKLNSGAAVYVNGAEKSLKPWTGANDFHVSPKGLNAQVVMIGKDAYNQTTLTTTRVDDFKLFKKTITKEEVLADYNQN